MLRSHSFAWILISLLLLALAASLQADITPSGDVDPADYSWWTDGGDSGTDAYIGETGVGSVTVDLGSDLSSEHGYIGRYSGSTGVVTVDGSGSIWTNSGHLGLYVGYDGQGTLNITNGGAVSNYSGRIGCGVGSTGEITVDGNGSVWTCGGLIVGRFGQGTLNITNGGSVISNDGGIIGLLYGSTGVVTVDGSGSTWTNSSDLDVGCSSYGTLNITNGGTVNVTGYTWVARNGGAASEIHFDDGTLTTGSFLAGATQLTGTGTINTHGLVSDVNLLFDLAHGLNQTLTFNEPGQNITINLTQDITGHLGAGYTGDGTLAIRDGVSVESKKGYIGYMAGYTGMATVDGSGSTWTCDEDIRVGRSGQGTLDITNGGVVGNSCGFIGESFGSTGVVTVDGNGSTWTSSDHLYVGYYGQGTLNITNGGIVSNTDGNIGCKYSSAGVVTVDGSGSTWACCGDDDYDGDLYVGGDDSDDYYWDGGQGTLNITNGGAVHVTGDTWVARDDGATGAIHFDDGTLTTGSLLARPTQLTGTGTINTHGLVSDVDLVFDSAHGLNQTLLLNSQSGQNITINLAQDGRGNLGAGYAGEGTLAIRDGVSAESSEGYIGYKAGATGVVTVDGNGSTWTNSGDLNVGYYGAGVLSITDGGTISNAYGYIGRKAGTTGEVTVDGSGSTWTNSNNLTVGLSGQGTLNITNGGAVVSSGNGYIGRCSGSAGEVTVDGSGSTWTLSGYYYEDLFVASYGQGTLNITGGGLVSVAGTLTIDNDGDGDGFINMASGGMLALKGQADDSLVDFMGLIDGTDAIRYWDDSASDWADITGATYGQDYTLTYHTEGDLAGYTMLTVPEPVTVTLMAIGGLAMLKRRR